MEYSNLIELFKENSDEKYKIFNENIIPDMGEAYGVRMPILKDIAKKAVRESDVKALVKMLHSRSSYEEKLMEGFLITYINFEKSSEMFQYIDSYVKRINNWALCDSFVSSIKKLVNKNKDIFYLKAKECITSENPWEIRFGYIVLLAYFCEEEYLEEILQSVESTVSDHYYVRMGKAWLISMLYFVNKNRVIAFLSNTSMDNWTVNKAFQKIMESRKVDKEEREYIKGLKRRA